MNVSIIVATFGDQKWQRLAQERALPSAEDQGAVQIIEHHAPLDTLAGVRNTAANQAKGDWLCFLDADDELEPGYLEAMAAAWDLEWSKTTQAPLLVPALRRVYMENMQKVAGMKLPERYSTTPAVIPNKGKWPQVNECVIGTLVGRQRFLDVGGFRDLTDDGEQILMYEDWDLWLRCWNSGARLAYVPAAVYREHVNVEGRNTNAHLSAQVYDAIWRDHERDTEVLGIEREA